MDTIYLTDISGTIGEWFDTNFDKEVPIDVVRLLKKAYDMVVYELENGASDTTHKYGYYPTMEEIKRDYNELMEIIKDVKTIEQAIEIRDTYKIWVEINGVSIDEYVNRKKGTNEDIEWIRYENYGCLSYIYDWFNGKPIFDVWSNGLEYEFITDITIDNLTEELYKNAKGI